MRVEMKRSITQGSSACARYSGVAAAMMSHAAARRRCICVSAMPSAQISRERHAIQKKETVFSSRNFRCRPKWYSVRHRISAAAHNQVSFQYMRIFLSPP